MAETLILTTPQSVTDYKIVILKLDWNQKSIVIVLEDTQGDKLKKSYSGAEAEALIIALNKANLSTLSLQKRILQRLVTDGLMADGAVTGSPD
jgi:hypothetical protein